MGAIAARAVDLVKVYGEGENAVHALAGVSADFAAGEFTAIMGPSGSGKSTLMHCLAGLDAASSGSVQIGDTELTSLSDRAMTALRRDRIGFVFQAFNLVPTLTALENITLPLDIAEREPDPEWLDTVIDRLGLRDRLDHRPTQLSGGQQQRVACARALAGRPEIIFGDEPTGNLDSRAGAEVLSILRAAVDEFHQTVVIVTHDPRAASYADRVVFLADGRIVDEMRDPTAEKVLERMIRFEGPVQPQQPTSPLVVTQPVEPVVTEPVAQAPQPVAAAEPVVAQAPQPVALPPVRTREPVAAMAARSAQPAPRSAILPGRPVLPDWLAPSIDRPPMNPPVGPDEPDYLDPAPSAPALGS